MNVAEHLRAHKADVATRWEDALRSSCPALGELDRAALIDHLPEFLDGVAAWIDGDRGRGVEAFETLAVGHALQRLGHGIDLSALAIEYQVLRTAILAEMFSLDLTQEVRRDLARLNAGLDEAILQAIRRYVAVRDEVRERFIGILGHDLRGPLQVAQLAFEQLAARAGGGKSVEVAARGLRALGRVDRMVHDLLDFAHSHLGEGIPVNPVENDMGEICRAVTDDARATHPARTIELETSGDLRGFWDRDRVVQAISNLVSNALEHGRDPIRVRAAGEAHFVVTDIENAGATIPREIVRRMFEPFHRSGASHGLGLGMFIARSIAVAHGGVCDVDSNEDGTRVRIAWPRVTPEELPGRP